MKKIIIIVVAVLVLAGVGVYMFVLPKPEEPEPISKYIPGDYFVTNINGSNKLVKVTVFLEVNKKQDDATFFAFLDEKQYLIRNAVTFTLRSKTEEELKADNAQEMLNAEITKKINDALEIDNVKNVYFSDYVIQ